MLEYTCDGRVFINLCVPTEDVHHGQPQNYIVVKKMPPLFV